MFLRSSRKSRIIHVHVGPHKTGSTAVQRDLADHGDRIARATGITPVRDQSLWDLAKALNRRDPEATEAMTKALVKRCSGETGDILLSCEDLAGELPGRAGNRQFYASLWGNLNHLRKAFPKDRLRVYFFLRDPDAWLRSAYVQILKHRTRFRSFDKYLEFLHGTERLWDKVIERPADRLGEAFITVPYEEGDGFSASHALLAVLAGDRADGVLPEHTARPNRSPSDAVIALLERANRSGASGGAVDTAKRVLLRAPDPSDASTTTTEGRPAWPPQPVQPDWLSPELTALWSRVAARTPWQDQPNLMPPGDCDLAALRHVPVEGSDTLPEASRWQMPNQSEILKHRLRGQPMTCWLLGLVISYLRRNTGHEEHAAHLFQRLWAEEHEILLGFLETRWLISTFQTFMEHGISEDQRMIGGAAFLFTNTLKAYEAERALDGIPPDQTYPNEIPSVKSGFWGLDRYRVGGTDMLLNTLAHLLELAAREDRVGRVLQEFLLRMKRHHTAFSRMDQTRLAQDTDISQFEDCWSFFEPPKRKD